MTVNDRTRQQLHGRLTDVLGEQEANILMAYLPTEISPQPTTSTATTRRRSFNAERDPRHELHLEIIPLRTEITTKVTELRTEMIIGFLEVKDEIHKAAWSVLMVLVSTTAVAAWLFAFLS